MPKLNVPSPLAIGLSALATLLAVLNVATGAFGAPWDTLVTAGLTALAGVGIAPLTGPTLRNALHIDYQLALAISSVLTTAAVGATALDVSTAAQSVIVGVLTAVAGLFAGPVAAVVPAAAK